MSENTVTIPLFVTPTRTSLHLIKIPPPLLQSPVEKIPNPSLWNEKEVVWTGSITVQELEDLDKRSVQGVILYMNWDGSVFGKTIYDPLCEEKDVIRSISRNKYKVLLTHEDKKIALGLIWGIGDDLLLAEFGNCLNRIKRDAELARDLDGDVESVVDIVAGLRIDDQVSKGYSIDSISHVVNLKDDDSDDDYGDFVD